MYAVVFVGTLWGVASSLLSTTTSAIKWIVGYQTAEQKRIAELEKRLKLLEEARDISGSETGTLSLSLSPQ